MGKKVIKVGPNETYINKLRIFQMSHGRIPTEKEFIDGKLGNKSEINRLFGSFELFLTHISENNLENIEFAAIHKDMRNLSSIMERFDCSPINTKDNKPKPINKAIFCNILAEKYPELRKVGVMSYYNKKSPKTPVAKFLGYGSNNAVKSNLRKGIISELKMMNKYADYKMIKATFEGDERCFQIELIKNNIIKSKNEIKRLTKEILEL